MRGVPHVKQCFKCHKTKSLDRFYKHPGMADGHLNKCKSCTKADVASNRLDKLEYYREQDRVRSLRPKRKAILQASANKARSDSPFKSKAHSAVRRAIARGDLVRPDCCQDCGASGKIHGHHEDYSKPLDVEWLCPPCHHKRHPKN